MAVISVKEINDGRRGNDVVGGDVAYTRVFRVITDSPYTSSYSVRYAPGIPRRLDTYVEADGTVDATAIATRVEEHVTDVPTIWEVTVTYSDNVKPEDVDPLLRPIIRKWSVERYQRVLTKDLDSKAIVNSAGEPFDPAAEVEETRPVLTITKIEDGDFDVPGCIRAFKDTLNESEFYGFTAGLAKLTAISGDEHWERNRRFWEMTYEFHFRLNRDDTDDWDLHLLDAGYYYKSGANLITITDKYGRPVGSPALLDGSGGKLAVGGTPVFLRFRGYDTADFGLLDLEGP